MISKSTQILVLLIMVLFEFSTFSGDLARKELLARLKEIELEIKEFEKELSRKIKRREYTLLDGLYTIEEKREKVLLEGRKQRIEEQIERIDDGRGYWECSRKSGFSRFKKK